jgi:hypothetical protein
MDVPFHWLEPLIKSATSQWVYENVIKGLFHTVVITAGLAAIYAFLIGPKRLRATQRLLARFEFSDRSLGGIRAWLATLWALRNPLKAKDLYKQMRLRAERHLIPQSRHQYEDNQHELHIDTVWDIYEARERLIDYLKQVAAANQHPRTLAKIRVEGGFVAPHHLLRGLLAAFKEEWGPLIEAYKEAESEKDDDPLVLWRQPQASMFLMWLIWGPSIPICTCDRWKRGALTLQYGTADEAISIPLRVYDQQRAGVVQALREDQDDPERALALPWSVVGTLTFGTEAYAEERKGEAPKEGKLAPAQQHLEDALILEYQGHAASNNPRSYYTAYVWVMFRICDSHGNPLWRPGKDSRLDTWLNLLPFFEHANIADRTAYEAAKRQLAIKVLPTLQSILEKVDENGTMGLQFKYACAIDDTMCRKGKPAFPLDGGERIRDLLLRFKKDMLASKYAERVDVAHQPDGHFSTCHLPDTIGAFSEAMTELVAPAKTKTAERG